MLKYTVVSCTVVVKALLLLSFLFLSAGTAKADADYETTPKAAYYYGTIYGVGSTLCSLVNDDKLERDYSRKYLAGLVDMLSEDPDLSDVSAAILKSYQDLKNEPDCKDKI